jgi:hypothetical protein
MAGEDFVRVSTPDIRQGAQDLRGLAGAATPFADRLAAADPLRHCGTDKLGASFASGWANNHGPDAVTAARKVPEGLTANADSLDHVADLFDRADQSAADQAGDAVTVVRAG